MRRLEFLFASIHSQKLFEKVNFSIDSYEPVVNSWLYRCAYVEITGESFSSFKKHVRLATVGDDNVASISSSVNFSMIKAAPLYREWGYVATPASKGGDFVDSLLLEDLVFVKRRFVKWEDGYYRSPIDPDSCYKALCFQEKEAGITYEQRLKNVSGTVLREFYLHGEERFNVEKKFLTEVFEERELEYENLRFEDLDRDVS